MAWLFKWILILALCAAVVVGVSWVLAYSRVAQILGSPPPQMGSQTTTFLWDGMPQVAGRPRVWSFSYAPTLIPGARNVRIYVTPMGHLVQTEPADLTARVKQFHNTGY
jgi:hypothetical protein